MTTGVQLHLYRYFGSGAISPASAAPLHGILIMATCQTMGLLRTGLSGDGHWSAIAPIEWRLTTSFPWSVQLGRAEAASGSLPLACLVESDQLNKHDGDDPTNNKDGVFIL